MVFLEDEVHHLDDAHVYFKAGGKNPEKSKNAIDLLLGTQGYEEGESEGRERRQSWWEKSRKIQKCRISPAWNTKLRKRGN